MSNCRQDNAVARQIQNEANASQFVIELGIALVPLVSPDAGDGLIARIRSLRKSLAQDEGKALPMMQIRDNLDLEDNAYRFVINGEEAGKGQIPLDWPVLDQIDAIIKHLAAIA